MSEQKYIVSNAKIFIMDFKGVHFLQAHYGPFITLSPKNCYRGIIIKNSCFKLYFPKIIIRNNLNLVKQLAPSEVKHSLILGSILNPYSGHGYGDIFLKEFFRIVVNDDNFVYEETERWLVTIEKGHFDINIRNENNTKIIIVENKSNWAEDQPNQLYRYWFNGIYTPQYRLEKHKLAHWAKIIYLSPSFEKQYDIQSITKPSKMDKNLPASIPKNIIKIIYYREEVVAWLNKCLTKCKNTSNMYFYIKQYKDFWEKQW